MRYHRRSQSVGELLSQALPEDVRERIFSIELVRTRWLEAVGEELALRSEPESLAERVLTVRVSDERWGRMIIRLSRDIIPVLNQLVGLPVVRQINFVKRQLPLPGKDMLRGLTSNPLPLQEPPLAESVAQYIASIADKELRTIVTKSAARYLGSRKCRLLDSFASSKPRNQACSERFDGPSSTWPNTRPPRRRKVDK